MRIIGGNSGGIRINFPKNLNLRPTTDRCKEALFNILNNLNNEVEKFKKIIELKVWHAVCFK